MNCHYCKSCCIKKGKRKTGEQKYQCTVCNKYQQADYKNKAWYPNTNRMIKRCVKRSGGIRGISFILEISATTVVRRIKRLGLEVKKPGLHMRGEYEADEIKTYVGEKTNEQWVIYAIDKRTKKVVDLRVGRRNKRNVRAVIETLLLANARKIYTDRLPLYKSLIPEKIHNPVPHNTNHIERKNLNIRMHVKCLSRRTICFSRSIAMLTAIMKIYFWADV